MALKITDLKIDINSLGGNFLLVDIAPYYVYDKDKKRTDAIEGYRYDIALPELKMEKLGVKIPISIINSPLVDITKDEKIPMKQVVFDGLEVSAYIMQGNVALKASATNVSFVKG